MVIQSTHSYLLNIYLPTLPSPIPPNNPNKNTTRTTQLKGGLPLSFRVARLTLTEQQLVNHGTRYLCSIMTDADPTTPKCAKCSALKSSSGVNLKRCAKCQTTWYCSRECQKAKWKEHKRVCASNAASAASGSNGPRTDAPAATSTSAGESRQGRSGAIDSPFHRLHAQT